MRIGFVSSLHPHQWGGAEMLWTASARAALTDGHAVAVSVCGSYPRSPEISSLRALGADLQYRRFVRHAFIQRRMDALLFPFHLLRRFAPDVLCLSQAAMFDYAEMFSLSTLVKLTRGWTVPYVLNCQYADDGYWLNSARRERAREVFQRATAVVYLSERNLEAYQRQLAIELPTAVQIPNPPNLKDRSPVAWPGNVAPVRMAYVGRLAGVKGLDLVFQVLGRPPWPDRDWRLDVYGAGPDEEHLRALVKLYGISRLVVFHGPTADVRGVWADHHLGLSPSRAEGMPITLAEAMLCGRPVVATEVGSAGEWVVDGNTGFLAPAATSTAIGAALERAWASRDRWPEIGRRAHERVSDAIPPDTARELLRVLEAAGRLAPIPSLHPST